MDRNDKVKASDGDDLDYFGMSVSISGDTAIIGASQDEEKGDFSGAAYVFEKIDNIWTETAKLTPIDGAASDTFGDPVSISGNTVIIGVYRMMIMVINQVQLISLRKLMAFGQKLQS